jgi:predicted ester cyclase
VSARAVVERFYREVWTEHHVERIPEIISQQCLTHQVRSEGEDRPPETRGPAKFATHIREWLTALPDLSATVDRSVVEGDRVVSWITMRGTHRGPWHGVAPTGKAIVVRSVAMHRVIDGLVVEDWVITDGFGFFQQLGLTEPIGDLIASATTRRKTGGFQRS